MLSEPGLSVCATRFHVPLHFCATWMHFARKLKLAFSLSQFTA